MNVVVIGGITFSWAISQFCMSEKEDCLWQQAHSLFSQLPKGPEQTGLYTYTQELHSQISWTRFHILLCAYLLDHPSLVRNYLHQQPPTFDFTLFTESLRSLTLYYHHRKPRYLSLLQLYNAITDIEPIKTALRTAHTLPAEIAQQIEADSQGQVVGERRGVLGMTKIAAINFQIRNEQTDEKLQESWKKIVAIIGESELQGRAACVAIATNLLKYNNYIGCKFILAKFTALMGAATLAEYLLQLLAKTPYGEGDKCYFRGYLSEMMEEFSAGSKNIPPSPGRELVRILAVLLKEGMVEYAQMGVFLTPQRKIFQLVEEKRLKRHQELLRSCRLWQMEKSERRDNEKEQLWGELTRSSKFELLTQLMSLNDYPNFKRVIELENLREDMLYHPILAYTIASLLEWLIEPLYSPISPARFFPRTPPRFNPAFPEGYFKQYDTISNEFFKHLVEILGAGRCYIFARRSTFVKICRLFVAACKDRLPEQSNLKGKATVIFNVVKKFLLPALQFQICDPTLSFELDELLQCFEFRQQMEIYNDFHKEHQFRNLHLTSIYLNSATSQTKYLNRLSNDNQRLISHKIRALLVSRPFSNLSVIVNRATLNANGFMNNILDVVTRGTKLSRKAAFFYVWLAIAEKEDKLIMRDGTVTQGYKNLVEFAYGLLLRQRHPTDYFLIILEYFHFKTMKYHDNITKMTPFEYFHAQIFYLSSLFQKLVPDQLPDDCVKEHLKIYLSAGPLMRAKLLGKSNEIYENRHMIRAFKQLLLDSCEKGQEETSFFYILVINLSQRMRAILENQKYNISINGYIHDSILSLLMSLINFVQFEQSSNEKQYYQLQFLPNLLAQNVPYQLAMQILRYNITQSFISPIFDFHDPDTWQSLRNSISQPIIAHLHTQLLANSGEQLPQYSLPIILKLLNSDAFLLFWVQDVQYFIPSINYYNKNIEQLRKKCESEARSRDRQAIQDEIEDLSYEGERNEHLHNKLLFKDKTKQVRSEYRVKMRLDYLYKRTKLVEKQRRMHHDIFMKYCLMPRSLLSKAETYYSASFLFILFRQNNTPIVTVTQIICQTLEQIAAYLSVSTERQSCDCLSLFSNYLTSCFHFWRSKQKLYQRLYKFQILTESLHSDDYDEILFLLYESQTKIIHMLTAIDNESYCVKNCLYFMFKHRYIPFCKEHCPILQEYFGRLSSKFADQEDILQQIGRLREEIKKRNELYTKEMKYHIRLRYDKKYKIAIEQKYSKNQLETSHESETDTDQLLLNYPSLPSSQSQDDSLLNSLQIKTYRQEESLPRNSGRRRDMNEADEDFKNAKKKRLKNLASKSKKQTNSQYYQ